MGIVTKFTGQSLLSNPHLIDVFKVLQREFVDKLFFDGHEFVQFFPQNFHHEATFV